MPTIHDLRDAFDARADDAPSVADLLATLPPESQHPWRTRAAIATGVGAVAAAVVAAFALTGTDPTRPADVPSAPPLARTTVHQAIPHVAKGPTPTRLRFDFRLGDVPGYTLQYSEVVPSVQTADVYVAGTTNKSIGDIHVYATGTFDPTAARQGTPVTVSGHAGFWADIFDPDTSDGKGGGSSTWAVVWEYSPGAWAVVQGDWAYQIAHGYLSGDAKQIQLAIAAAVDTEGTHRLPVPLRLTYLPDGVVVQDAGFAPDDSQAEIGLTDGGAPDSRFPGNIDTVQIQVNQYDPDPDLDLRQADAHGNLHVDRQGGYTLQLGTPVDVAGARAFQDTDGNVTVLYDDRSVTVGYIGSQPQRVSAAQLLKIAQGLRMSPSLADRSTWFDGLTIGP